MDNLIEKQKIRILFFASDPSDESRLHLGQELQTIRGKLKGNDNFELKDQQATKHNDVMNEIMNYKPQIVHFSGHGTPEGELKFEDELGNSKTIPPEALAKLFELAKDFVKCVIVNTCYSAVQAEAIARYIPIVIGTKSDITDDAAISFSSGFYTALNPDLSIESFEKAYNLGDVAIQFSGNEGEHLKPIIKYGTPDLRFAAEVDTAFGFIKDPKGSAVKSLIAGLTYTGKKMEVPELVVKDIIEKKLSSMETHNKNLLEYENNLKEILRDEYPLSDSSIKALFYLQTGLNLNNEDVKLIHEKILSDPKQNDSFSWYDRGTGQQNLGNYDLSIDYYTKAIEKDKGYSAAYYGRGLSYNKKDDFKMAINDYSKAIEINKNWEITSNLSLAYFYRGFAYLEMGSNDRSLIEKGIEDNKKVIELDPVENAAYYNLAIGYERLNDFREAVKWFIEALERGYTDKKNTYSWIIKCYTELGDAKKREEWIKKAAADLQLLGDLKDDDL